MRKPGLTTQLRFRTPRTRLPRELGNGGLFFASVLINAIGYGVYVPFAVLYFHLVVGLSLPLVGLGLTIATGVGLVMTPIGGPLIDRFGARNVALVTNLLGAIGFAAYLTVHSFVGFLTVALFLALGRTGAGTADQALVVDLAAPEVRDRWYAFVRMAFNAGAGALLASALVATGGTSGYRWVVALNGVSFALAAGLVFLICVSHMSEAAKAQSGSYRVVLRDRPFLGLVGANAILWISVAVLEVGLPPYLIVAAHAPAWIASLDRWDAARTQHRNDRGAADACRAGCGVMAADARHDRWRPWLGAVVPALGGRSFPGARYSPVLSLRVRDPVHADGNHLCPDLLCAGRRLRLRLHWLAGPVSGCLSALYRGGRDIHASLRRSAPCSQSTDAVAGFVPAHGRSGALDLLVRAAIARCGAKGFEWLSGAGPRTRGGRRPALSTSTDRA
jgi:MFS family permease